MKAEQTSHENKEQGKQLALEFVHGDLLLALIHHEGTEEKQDEMGVTEKENSGRAGKNSPLSPSFR